MQVKGHLQVHVNPVTRAEVPRLLELMKEFAQALEERFGQPLNQPLQATEEGLAEALFGDPSSAEAVLVRCEGEVCGYAIFWRSFSTWMAAPVLYIASTYIRPEHRVGAVSMQLYYYLYRLAESRGYASIEGRVHQDDAHLFKFYTTLGAVCEEYGFFNLKVQHQAAG